MSQSPAAATMMRPSVRALSSRLSLLLLALSAIPTSAILVAPASQCATSCGNVLSSTSGTDLICSDSGFSSVTGQTLQNCLSCELNSTYVDPATKQTDLLALLYNLRYLSSWCIFGYPNNTALQNTPCITASACGQLSPAFEYGNMSITTDQYGYCSGWSDLLVPHCTDCLLQLGDSTYLRNFIIALSAGCQQQPASGSTLSLLGSLFSSTEVQITTPTPTFDSTPYTSNSGPLSLGAKIGIAIGGIVFLLIIAGCCIIWRGKRRRRAVLSKIARESSSFRAQYEASGGQGMFQDNSPQSESARAFMSPQAFGGYAWNGTDDSPQSATGYQHQNFSPYHSLYNSPVSPIAGKAAKERDWIEGGTFAEPHVGALQKGSLEVDAIEMSPIQSQTQSEHEQEQWAKEARQAGFVTSPPPLIRHPTLPREYNIEGMGVAI